MTNHFNFRTLKVNSLCELSLNVRVQSQHNKIFSDERDWERKYCILCRSGCQQTFITAERITRM